MWIVVDPLLPSSPEVIRIPQRQRARCLGVWIMAACWTVANEYYGYIPTTALSKIGATRRNAEALVAVGLWQHAQGGYHFTDLYWDVDDRRPHFSPELRARIYARDGHRCLHCGTTEDLTLDHVYPRARGGTDLEENLQTLCRSCNGRKGARVT